jgi:hypothetical protein
VNGRLFVNVASGTVEFVEMTGIGLTLDGKPQKLRVVSSVGLRLKRG